MIFRILLVILTSVVFIACQKSEVENTVLPFAETSPKVEPIHDSSVRKIDFKNFTYSYPNKDYGELLKLKNGKKDMSKDEDGAEIGQIEYGDVTNDGVEDAMVDIFPVMTGNCQCENVFIYTSENKKPKLLWGFDTWDRAEGGFKKAYSESGNLAVETFGDNKFENEKWSFNLPKEGAGGLCCPTKFTKIVFNWSGEKFVPFGERQVFDYDFRKAQQSPKAEN
jgi:hypothetical protein